MAKSLAARDELAVPDLYDALRRLVAQIPPGRVTTYGALAIALGDVAAARWVGYHLLNHQHTGDCACHRVVRAGGHLGGYVTNDPRDKAARLSEEGVPVPDGIVDLAVFGFDTFQSERPLKRLSQLQERLAGRVKLRPLRRPVRYIAGVDASYRGQREDCEGVAAYVLWDIDQDEVVWTTTVTRPVRFPYISSYLAFRELPLLLELIDKARRAERMADVLLVDGSGILHPRHAGIATQLGVILGQPTIGVTKKLLCGRVESGRSRKDGHRPVVYGDRLLGIALRQGQSQRKLLYVSPGHLVDVAACLDVSHLLNKGRRLPEPLYWADRLSRQAARS